MNRRSGDKETLDLLVSCSTQACRSLARTPYTTAIAVLCLAGAVAAATTVFSIVDGVVLRALPFRHAARLVAIWAVDPSRDAVKRGFSWPDVRDVARDPRSLDGVAAMSNGPNGMTLTGVGDPVQIPARIVSGSFFEVLGVDAAIGRTLTADDDRPGSAATVVIGHALWTERFGGDPGIAGRRVTLDGRAFVVAGVAPRGFAYPPDAKMWVTPTHGAPDDAENRNIGWLEVIGRLKPGVTPEMARADLAVAFADLSTRYHPSRGKEDLSVVPLDRELLGDTRPALWALLAAVLVVLLVACANVGGLLLARGAARGRELALRVALGAERGDIVRLAFGDALVLAMAGGAAGIALSTALVGAARRLAPADIPHIAEITIDARVLVFATLLVSFAALVCTLIPALQSTSGDLLSTLQSGGRSATADGAVSRRILAGSEIALSVVLIVSAVLVGRTFLNLRGVDVGFHAEHVLAFDVPQPATRYPTSTESLRFAERLLPRLTTLPGVTRAASVLLRPLWGEVGMDWPVTIDGQAPADAAKNPLTNLEAISPGYFDTLGIPILEGRDIRADDAAGRPGVAVVGRGFARRFWPDGRAIGRRLKLPLPGSPYSGQWFTVVGIVGDAKYRSIRGSRLDLYISAAHCPYPVHQFVVRTDLRAETLAGAIRAEVRAIDPDLPIDDVVMLGDEVSRHVANPRFVAAIFVAFAAVATALAAIGLATLIAWQVAQRTREIGIRMALGATAPRVIRSMMADGAVIVVGGVVAGLAIAAAATTWLRSILYEISPHDSRTLAMAAVVAAGVGLLSVYVPARRASGVDPLVALRQD